MTLQMISYRFLRHSIPLLLWCCSVCVCGSPALSQSAPEAELEDQSRDLILGVVKPLRHGLRWKPGLFPLRVAVGSGEQFKTTGCPAQWRRELDEYLDVVNKQEILLVAVPPNDPNLAVLAYFGSSRDLEESDIRKQLTLAKKPTTITQFLIHSHVDESFLAAYGTGDFVEFGINFQELNAEQHGQRCPYLASFLGRALLQNYAMYIHGGAMAMFGEDYDRTIAWRAHRRLLAAMRKLPPADLDWGLIRPALIELLSRD